MSGGTLVIPLACQHASEGFGNHTFCKLHRTWVECQTSHWGEPPMCAYVEPDNSDEAMAARLEWVKGHKEA